MQIIGIVGPICSGKGTVIDYLVEKEGFIYKRLSSALYKIAEERGIDEKDREALQDLGDALRKEHGTSYLAEVVANEIEKEKGERYVVDSIRNPGEIKALKDVLGRVFVLCVTAPLKLRFERAKGRGRFRDTKMRFKEFKRINDRDLGKNTSSEGQNVGACMEMADAKIVNDSSVEKLRRSVEGVLGEIDKS